MNSKSTYRQGQGWDSLSEMWRVQARCTLSLKGAAAALVTRLGYLCGRAAAEASLIWSLPHWNTNIN